MENTGIYVIAYPWLPHWRATISLLSNSALDRYSGSFNRLILKKENKTFLKKNNTLNKEKFWREARKHRFPIYKVILLSRTPRWKCEVKKYWRPHTRDYILHTNVLKLVSRFSFHTISPTFIILLTTKLIIYHHNLLLVTFMSKRQDPLWLVLTIQVVQSLYYQ